ncbi:hypothetical protein [Pandoraea sputorum]|uniref:hypothetical protein n=1 Tax=Pandoraea sputorum TaxID=93222 RepID=UPI00124180B2|nr:hypothetical protein [Pandoraea sputorum]VVE78123.1 hypothetical protein PSP31120_01503 [Pandoraea sputorum]
MRQKVQMKMGTLRKIDSRITRFKVGHADARHKHDEMRLHERIASVEAVLPTLATKEDLAREFGTVRAETHLDVGGLRSEMHQEFGKVRQEMHQEFGNVRQEFGKVRQEMHQGFGELRREMHQEFGKVRSEIAGEIASVRSDMHALGAGLHRELHALTWRLIGTIVTVGTALVAATHFLSKISPP